MVGSRGLYRYTWVCDLLVSHLGSTTSIALSVVGVLGRRWMVGKGGGYAKVCFAFRLRGDWVGGVRGVWLRWLVR